MQAGLGGGSSDAAAALRGAGRALARAIDAATLRAIAGELGADVPFFLEGGTRSASSAAICCFRLTDRPPAWVVLVLPGVRRQHEGRLRVVGRATAVGGASRRRRAGERRSRAGADEIGQRPRGAGRRRTSRDRADRRARCDAPARVHAAMSGSGSAVFGLFRRAPRPTRPPRRAAGRARDATLVDARPSTGRSIRRSLPRASSPSDKLTVCAAWLAATS